MKVTHEDINKISGVSVQEIDHEHIQVSISFVLVKQRPYKSCWLALMKEETVGRGNSPQDLVQEIVKRLGYGKNIRYRTKKRK